MFAGYSKQIKEGNIMAIKSDDPHAIEKLTDKLEKCEKKQSFMKQVNAYYRKNGTAKEIGRAHV